MDNQEKFKIDIKKLQNQLKSEILTENKYMTENNAKLRAVEQRISTYEDFRQIVLASHLKPLEKYECHRDQMKSSNKIWNSIANSNSDSFEISTIEVINSKDFINTDPKTNVEFLKIWKELDNYCFSERCKWNFLKNLGTEKIRHLFRFEINGDLLGTFLSLFREKIQSNNEYEQKKNDIDFIFELLKIFPKSNRFGLSVMFLTKDQIEDCKQVFDYLDKHKLNINDLKKLYY